MAGTRRRPRNPTISKLMGTDFETVSEFKSKEENKQRRNKMQHYTPKKKVILLPGTVLDTGGQNKSKEKNNPD
jgi:ribosomal protein L18E